MESQDYLFDLPPAWIDCWKGMPSYRQEDQTSWAEIKVHFRNRKDLEDFARLIGQRIYPTTRSIWYPEATIASIVGKKYVSKHPPNLKYPVYVISKGRWESRLTSKALEKINVPYKIVIEPQEFDQYAAVIDPAKILILPFGNLGQGSIPARNWVWEHSIARGDYRHWILDDNISGFYRLHKNLKTPVADGTIFRAAEDFVDRYENVGKAGFNYFMFAKRKDPRIAPIYLNTRIYSCILLRNDLMFRWRGRYNEDTDLSIRILKSGLCTVLFNAFLAGKSQTMTMKGGNTDELYQGDGRLAMAQSLAEQHPDIVKVVTKWGRPQHHVDYRGFKKNKLILKPGIDLNDEMNDYGMYLHIEGENGNQRKT